MDGTIIISYLFKVADLRDAIEKSNHYLSLFQVADLRDELEKRGLDTKGTKPFLIERLKVPTIYLYLSLSIYL